MQTYYYPTDAYYRTDTYYPVYGQNPVHNEQDQRFFPFFLPLLTAGIVGGLAGAAISRPTSIHLIHIHTQSHILHHILHQLPYTVPYTISSIPWLCRKSSTATLHSTRTVIAKKGKGGYPFPRFFSFIK